MVLPGQSIPTKPPKRPKTVRKAPAGSLTDQLAQQQKREDEASQAALSALTNPLANPPPNARVEPEPGEDDQNQLEQGGYSALTRDDRHNPAISDTNNNSAISRAEYYRSVTYQERTLREEANWRAVLPKLFISFMICSRKTYQWCDRNLWNKDFNTACKCKDWQRRTVQVDVVDLTFRDKISVEVCNCTSDLVRLLRLGYMGTSPMQPRTGFSLRLLRFHHTLWKHSSVRLAAVTEAIDEYLEPRNPLFVVPGTDHTQDLRKCFSAAVDAYREMIRMEGDLGTKALWLTPLDSLAQSCPSCFGPKVDGKQPTEPDYIICLDANFQQRRHLAASAAWRGDTGILPSLFLSPAQVRSWKSKTETNNRRNTRKPVDEVVDPCSAQHTAANDTRGRQTWRGCDETGLMGMACRHDILLKFINIVQTGEKGYYPLAMLDWILKASAHPDREAPRFGVLYDIGCSMEKGIVKRDYFAEERRAGRVQFGTSVFHSYVHQWCCQLKYNPRLNVDWGLSDGEGLERIWSSLASLVSALRYSTKAHRLCALNLRTHHTNELKRRRVIQWSNARFASSQKLHHTSMLKMINLQRKNPRYTEDYFVQQWTRQRESQLQVMVVENSQLLNGKLGNLVDLEEDHRKAEEELQVLQNKRRNLRTAADKKKIEHLPVRLLILEDEINELVVELGGDHYRDMPGWSTPKGKLLIRIRVAKAKLYGAKVDVFESQKQNDQREGTRMQQRSKKHLREKQADLKKKYKIFERIVKEYNNKFPSPDPIECPPFEEIQRLLLEDLFWDIGQLTHPGEPWAADPDTRDGIRACLDYSHSQDELNRIGRKCRQAVKWALDIKEKLSVLLTALEIQDNNTETVANKWLVSLVNPTWMPPLERLETSKEVLWSLHEHFSRDHARLSMFWNIDMLEVLNQTRSSTSLSDEEEVLIKTSWGAFVTENKVTWKERTEADIIESTPLGEGEEIELRWGLLDDGGEHDMDESEAINDLIAMALDDVDEEEVEVEDHEVEVGSADHAIETGRVEVEGDHVDQVDGVE